MNTSIKFRDTAAKAAMAIPELREHLKKWHNEQAGGKAFEPWLADLIEYLAANFPENVEVTADAMVNALKVQAVGIPSVLEVAARDKKSFELDDADVNFSVEDGIVSASVWYKGKWSEAASESTKDFFEANGYSVSLFHGETEEEDDEWTVNASRAFDGKEVK